MDEETNTYRSDSADLLLEKMSIERNGVQCTYN